MKAVLSQVMMVLALATFGAATVNAASLNDVYPKPQQIKAGAATLDPKQLSLATLKQKEMWPILDACKAQKIPTSGTLKIAIDDKGTTLKKRLGKQQPVQGAYFLKISGNGIEISAADSTGIFYAAQTIAQMVNLDGKIGCGEVVDWPDVPFRGTVEGFYGRVWSMDARASQMKFYGKYKMNVYVYSPKDDPYHLRNWRELYPADKQKEFKELLEIARKNHVYFTWTVHLGASFNKNNVDGELKALRAKLESMYAIGFRAFGGLFDDFGGHDADLHAKLCNFIQKFSDEKGDCAPVIMCPSQYNKGWSGGDYLDKLGNALDKRINVFWTGDTVCHDITGAGTDWINARLKRNNYTWWNWPVCDYCSTSLLLGRTYGLDPANKGKLNGFASNPMDKPEASKIALFGVGDWSWNMSGFDSVKSWKAGIKQLFPKYADAMQTLANHSSDQGKNVHGYRREESVDFKPIIDKAGEEMRSRGTIGAGTAKEMKAEFAKMRAASETLSKEIPKDNPELWTEIQCWVKNLGAIGYLGETVATLGTSGTQNSAAKRAHHFGRVLAAYTRQQNISAKQIQHAQEIGAPHQKPAVVGGLVLMPFFDSVLDSEWKRICKLYTGKDKIATSAAGATYDMVSNVDKLKKLPVTRDGNVVKAGEFFEQVKFDRGNFAGILLPGGVIAQSAHFRVPANKTIEMEITTDGKVWKKAQNVKVNGENIKAEFTAKQNVRGVRVINKTGSVMTKVNLMQIEVPANARANSMTAVTDGDPFSYFTIQGNRPVTFKAPGKERDCLVLSDLPDANIKKSPGQVIITPVPKKNGHVFEILWK